MSLIEKAAEKLKEKENLLKSEEPKAVPVTEPKAINVSQEALAETETVKAPQKSGPKKSQPKKIQVPNAGIADTQKRGQTVGVKLKTKPVVKKTAADIKNNVESDDGCVQVELNFNELIGNNILTMNRDNSIISEEFRIIKRRLLLNAFAKGENSIVNGNIIMVTSTQPDEGKTFCALSLALSMAKERDLTVLLVDADVAKPDVLKYMGANGGRGLIDVIEDDTMDLRDCLLKTNIPNLSILPAGKKHTLTTELLASERMGGIIREIAQRYHDRVVIIDSPPVLASSSASVLALNVGQILFVVEAERTRETELNEALSMINSCQHINLVLNKTRFTVGKKKFGSYYGYGYNL